MLLYTDFYFTAVTFPIYTNCCLTKRKNFAIKVTPYGLLNASPTRDTPTDRPTDTASYRGALAQLKMSRIFVISSIYDKSAITLLREKKVY